MTESVSKTPGAGSPAMSKRNRIRVLHIVAGKLYGGVETLLVTLARLRDVCPDMEPCFAVCFEGRVSRELREAGATVYVLGDTRMSRPWTVIRARRRLRAFLAEGRFDVVFCHLGWSMALFGETARASGVKTAFWAHGFQTGKGWLERMTKRTRPDLVISNSRFTASSVSNLLPNTESQVVYCPVALTPFPEAADWRKRLRSEHAVSDDTTVIIQVSRLEAWKGHRLHLRALSLLKDPLPWQCWFVGGPQNPAEETYLADLKKMVDVLGLAERVRFLGQRSDVRNLLAAADLFCQPNEAPEPFGIVFIEALWAGLPVVSTAMGGAFEIVDESCGLLTKTADAENLAASLRLLIESGEFRARLGARGPARARKLCDPAVQIQAIGDLARHLSAGVKQ